MSLDLAQVAADFKNVKRINGQPNWEQFLRKYQCDYICELGIYLGDDFMEMLKHAPKLAVAVDKWRDDGPHPRKYDDYTQAELDQQYEYFKARVAENPAVQIVRTETVKAAEQFPDNYFDFVYIDADHSMESCLADIRAWYPKVKVGKFLAGHDYRRGFGVVEAVNQFLAETKLEMIFRAPSTWAVIKQ